MYYRQHKDSTEYHPAMVKAMFSLISRLPGNILLRAGEHRGDLYRNLTNSQTAEIKWLKLILNKTK